MAELHGESYDSADDPDPAPDANETAEAGAAEQDIDVGEEDAEPLTRQEWAELMRQGPALEEQEQSADYGDDEDLDAAYAEEDELPEPRTRQEIAEETRAANTDPSMAAEDMYTDEELDAIYAAEDQLPEPLTRQEVAELARSGTAPLTHDGSQEGNNSSADQADADMAFSEPKERALPEPQSAEHDNRQQGDQDGRDGPNPWFSVMEATPDDRTLGDTTPAGIGRKPTGEQLLEKERKAESWKEAFRDEIYEQAGDITDVAEKWGQLGAQLSEQPPASSHSEVATGRPEVPQHEHHGVEGGQSAIAGFVVGLLAFDAFRRIKNRIETWRGRSS